mgnify:CR=1 FL=1
MSLLRRRIGLPLLLIPVISCATVEEKVFPALEAAHRSVQRGRISEGLSGYARAAETMLGYSEERQPVWLRPFLLYSIQSRGLLARPGDQDPVSCAGLPALERFLGVTGPELLLPESVRSILIASAFSDQPGRWSRVPSWALPDLLRMTSEVLSLRARSDAPLLASPPSVSDVMTDALARLALGRAACQFSLRAWEMAVDQRGWDRDCRLCFVAAARQQGAISRRIAGAASAPDARERWRSNAVRWEDLAGSAEERVPLGALGINADVDFVSATVQDHFEDGLKSYGAAVEEYSGRGTRELAEEQFLKCLAHLMTARELRATMSKEETIRFAITERAVLGIRRLIAPP